MGALGKLITAAAVVAGAVGLVGVGLKKANTYDHAEEYTAGDITITEPVTNIDLNYSAGNITVSAADVDAIEVRESAAREIPDDLKVHTWVHEGTLYVKSYASGASLKDVNFDKKLTVTIPTGMELNKTKYVLSAGNLDYKEVSADQLQFTLHAGNLKCENTNAETLDISISSGNVTVSDICGKTLTVKTSAGNQEIRGIDYEEVTTKTAAGNLTAVFAATPGKASLKVSAGNVVVTLPQNPDIEVKVKASTGDITCGLPASYEHDTYKCGAGKNRMEITASAGDVTIR